MKELKCLWSLLIIMSIGNNLHAQGVGFRVDEDRKGVKTSSSSKIIKLKENKLQYNPEWEDLKRHNASPEWLSDQKFGVYFHWGLYSVPAKGGKSYGRFMYVPDRNPKKWGGEIYKEHRERYGDDFEYHDFIPMWKAEKFNAKKWVDLFVDSGFKLIGTMGEHHDGFSLWNSDVNEWNSVKMGPQIDIVKAIRDEARKRDLKFMTTFHHGMNLMFYPKQDNTWLRPASVHQYVYQNCEVPQDSKYSKLYGNMSWDDANNLWLDKLNEVVKSYNPDFVWLDYGSRYVKESHRKQFLANYYNHANQTKQEVVVNTKVDFFPKETAIVTIEKATMPNIRKDVWVTDFTLGASFSFDEDKRKAINPSHVIKILSDVASKNGLLLLTAGPKPDGTFPEEQLASLKVVGNWLKLYGEAIYNTRPFVFFGEGSTQLKPNKSEFSIKYGALVKGFGNLSANDIRYTTKGKTIYAIQLGWNPKEKIKTLSVFSNKAKHFKIKKISVLGSNEHIKWKKTVEGLAIHVPSKMPKYAATACVYKIEIE